MKDAKKFASSKSSESGPHLDLCKEIYISGSPIKLPSESTRVIIKSLACPQTTL